MKKANENVGLGIGSVAEKVYIAIAQEINTKKKILQYFPWLSSTQLRKHTKELTEQKKIKCNQGVYEIIPQKG